MEILLLVGLGLLAIIAYLVFFKRQPEVKPSEKWFSDERIAKKERPKAPITGICQYCQTRLTLPFKCKYCGGLFCDDHRMPEQHDCSGIKGLRREKQV